MSFQNKLSLRQVVRTSVVCAAIALTTPFALAQTVSNIIVQGNQRVEDETVRSYLALKPGQGYDATKVDESLKALYSTGLFSDVKISRSGNQVIVYVNENQILNRVAFEGNKKIEKAQLQNEVESKPRGTFTRQKVQSDTQRIIEVYRRSGRFDVKVEPKIIELEQNRVDLVFEINEGDKTKIDSINFIGNSAFSAGRLRDVITTTESNWLSFLKTSDVYDPDRLNVDQELLRRFYVKNGYADFRVISAVADYDREKNAFFINFTIEEGEQYTFGAVNMESNIASIDAAGLSGKIRSKAGSVYNAELIDKTIEDVGTEIARRGYPFAQVRPRGERDPVNRVVNVTYVIEEGARVYVERINIRGNTRTMDKVLRREMEIAEGDAFNRVLVDKSERRLNQLGYFKKVAVTREPGSASDRVVLNVNVEEQSTGEVSFGAGYATNDGFIADVGITEKNFLGRGQYVRTAVGWGERRRSLDFSFTEPYFLDRRLSAGFDAFYRKNLANRASSFEQEILGGGLRLGVTLMDDLTLQTRYRGYTQKITVPTVFQNCPLGVDLAPANGFDDCLDDGEASTALILAQGDSFVSMGGFSLMYNKLDNNKNPRNGYLLQLDVDVAGLGGDVKFVRTIGEARGYYNFYEDLVGMVKIHGGNIAGWGGDDVRLVDSFFKGGEFVRGFMNSGIGPRDMTPNLRGDALGGTTYVGATAEIQFPIPGVPEEMGLKGALFADAGTLFNVGDLAGTGLVRCPGGTAIPVVGCNYFDDSWSIRSSVGVSILWQSPLGPLRFDFAHALSKETYDQTQVFRFSGGSSF